MARISHDPITQKVIDTFDEVARLTRERDEAREALHDFLPRIEATEKTSRLLYRTIEGLKVERDDARLALRDLVDSTSWIGEHCVIDQSSAVGSNGALDRAMQKLVEWEREDQTTKDSD